ncbi:MAG: hypothetical protein ACXQS8_06430 [Candidatus Helarchaeales archaeon]
MKIRNSGLRAIHDATFLAQGFICVLFGNASFSSPTCVQNCSSFKSCSLITTIRRVFRGLGGEIPFDAYLDAYKKIKKIENVHLRKKLMNELKWMMDDSRYFWCKHCDSPARSLWTSDSYCINCLRKKENEKTEEK